MKDENIKLEEKDWRDARDESRDSIRRALLSIELSHLILEKCERKIRIYEKKRKEK